MNIDFIIVGGSPGNGKTTLSAMLHRHFQSPYFEFGWIPEFRMLAPSLRISQREEEQLSFENLVLVAKNYRKHGFKHVILTDLDDARMLDIPRVFAGYRYIILTLYSDKDEIIKNRILGRDNGNTFKDWQQSVRTNALIKKRKLLPNEYRILNSGDDPNPVLQHILSILDSHVPATSDEPSGLQRDDFFSYIDDNL